MQMPLEGETLLPAGAVHGAGCDTLTYTIFNDSIHGTVNLHPLLVKIIDTPEFQRLRDIKQLGPAYRVYPGASHNRFEHSIGVAHLAGVFAEKLEKQHPDKVSKEDILCLKVAGLCHDLGHGPFSHLFDKEYKERVNGKWTHEELSQKIIRHLLTNTEIKEAFKNANIDGEEYLEFICQLIVPSSDSQVYKKKEAEGKKFLFEIVSSKTGLDVDRWDYFERDCMQLGLRHSFDYRRSMEMARVIDGEICYRDKEAVNIYNMFVTRYNLYRCAYLHKAAMAVELMITDALYLADEFLEFEASDVSLLAPTSVMKKLKLSELGDSNDMSAYCQATDSLYYKILRMSKKEALEHPEAAKAQALLQRIEKRDFYELIAKTQSFEDASQQSNKEQTQSTHQSNKSNTSPMRADPKIIKEVISKSIRRKDHFKNISGGDAASLEPENLVVKLVPMGFGSHDKYPLERIYFFSKDQPNKKTHMCEDQLPLPVITRSSTDVHIRVYCRKKSSSLHKEQFEEWLKDCLQNARCCLHKNDLTRAYSIVIASVRSA